MVIIIIDIIVFIIVIHYLVSIITHLIIHDLFSILVLLLFICMFIRKAYRSGVGGVDHAQEDGPRRRDPEEQQAPGLHSYFGYHILRVRGHS